MSSKRIAHAVAVVAALAAAVLAATVPAGAGVAAASKNLVIGGRDVSRTLDAESAYIPDITARTNLYDNLLELGFKANPANQGGGQIIDPDPAKIKPKLATSWKSSENGTLWTFNLRQGVKSAFGNELTSEDVKWSLERSIAIRSTGFNGLVATLRLAKVEAPSKYVVLLRTTGQSAALLVRLASQWYYPIYDSTEVKKHTTAADPWARNWLSENSAGFGPYVLSSWVKGQQMVFKSRGDYWGPKPYYSQVTILAIPNNAGRLSSLQQNNLQMALDLSPDALEAARKDSNLKIFEFSGNNNVNINLNYNVPFFKDRRVREAMMLSVPYADIIKAVYFGHAEISKSPMPPYFFAFTPRYWRYPTNYDLAKKILAQSPYPNGFEVTMSYANEHPELDPLVAALVAGWAKIGIKVNLEKGPESVLVGRALGPHDIPMYISNTGSPEAPDPSTVTSFMIKGSVANVNNYFNPRMETLHKMGLNTLTQSRRRQIYYEVQKILMTDLPSLRILIFRETIAARKEVTNYRWWPTHATEFAPLKAAGT